MRSFPWPASHRIDPAVSKDAVISAINGMYWHQDEWRALQVVANLNDSRAHTPKSYVAFLKRSKARFWSPSSVLFWWLIITTQRFYEENQVGPGSF